MSDVDVVLADVVLADEAERLVRRVEGGELSRDALELLAGVEHRAARRALGRLPLVLTPLRAEVAFDRDVPASLEPWLHWGERLEPFGRALAVHVALAASDCAEAYVRDDVVATRAQLVGLHTGPAGALVIGEELARTLAPLSALVTRAREAARAWLADPDDEHARALRDAWPALLHARLSVALLAELAGVDWSALWVVRWMVGAVTGPAAHAGVAAGTAVAYAHSLGLDGVTQAVRDVLVRKLL